MATYNLTIIIDHAVLTAQSSDNLCIAKKVAGQFTTVFQDASIKPKLSQQKTLLRQNVFQWADKYRVFCTTTYAHGMLIESATSHVETAFGKQSTYENGDVQGAVPAAPSAFTNPSGLQSHEDSFLANMIPNTLHTAVECEAGSAWVPIYVDPDTHISTINKQLTPMNEYMLFWDSSVRTASMIDASRFAYPFTFSFANGSTAKTVRFGFATPDQPGPNEPAKFYDA